MYQHFQTLLGGRCVPCTSLSNPNDNLQVDIIIPMMMKAFYHGEIK